jgi:subtilisin family serine protease
MKFKSTLAIALAATIAASPALAQKRPGGGSGGSSSPSLAVQPWMNPEISEAWSLGYRGQGVTITVVDDFRSNWGYYGNLTGTTELLRHGEWTLKEASMIAPSATMRAHEFTSGSRVSLSKGLNVLNLSYGMMAPAGYSSVRWSAQEASIIDYARKGTAVISKAAGNDYGTAVGSPNANGQLDYLNRDLIGAQAAIFVGALNANGTTSAPATMASYSNVAGANSTVQNQFVVVGVEGNKTGLYGTSFAAPIVSGYAAIVGSKFTKATPTQITNQLLNTARTDTVAGYNPAVHGRGEASISRAIAPVSIR